MKQLIFRKANIEDVNLIFDWVNDSVVRKNSINKNKISLKEHQEWFYNKVNDPYSFFFIVKSKEIPENIGYVRFDLKENHYILSYLISEKFRGKGLAKPMIRQAISLINDKIKNEIYAYVDKKNTPSNKVMLAFSTTIEEEIINDKIYNKYILKNYER